MLALPTALLPTLLAALLGGGAARPPCDCQCGPTSAPEAFDRAALVFTGLVVSGELPPRPSETELLTGYVDRGVRVRYRFAVEEAFKGAAADTVEVWGGECAYDYEVGARYLVFALEDQRPRGTRYFAFIEGCTPTALLHDAEAALAYLRSGRE